jgi:type IV pilus assembly protein PilB
MKKITNDQLAQTLKDLEVIDAERLDSVIKLVKEKKLDLADYLIEKEILSSKNIGMIQADLMGIPFVELQVKYIESDIREIIPLEIAKKHHIISFEKKDGQLSIATSQIIDDEFKSFLHKKTGLEIKVFFASKKDIENTFNLYIKDQNKQFEEILKRASQNPSNKEDKASPPIIELVNKIIEFANKSKASDIHVEPEDERALVRFRIDGVLQDILQLPYDIFLKVVMRLKIMSHLKTDEHQASQDGKIQFDAEDEKLDIRISIVPITGGEKIVMRLLSEKSRKFSLSDLGIRDEDLKKLEEAYKSSYGMILTTGPTGSGKTTSLYSILKILNKRDINIMTIEDPVEYDMDGINQIQVNKKTDLTFAAGLRSIVRLVRKICQSCRISQTIDKKSISNTIPQNSIDRLFGEKETRDLYFGKGCKVCHETGYKDRVGIFEVMVIDEEIKEGIMNQKNSDEIKQIAVKNGMTTMTDDGIEKVKEGITTLEEILRVIKE